MEIVKYKPVNKNFFIAIFSLKLPKWGGFIINEMKYFNKNGQRWVSFPSKEYESNGEKKYYSLNTFDTPEMMEKFREQVISALDTYIQNNPEDKFPKMQKTTEERIPF